MSHSNVAQIGGPRLYDKITLQDSLTHIRLLHLQPSLSTNPGNMLAPLRCTMSTTSIDMPSPFEALSYTWGPPEQPHRNISIAGVDVEITKSLDTALRYLRRQNETVTLWIDQVCINQKNVEEKNKQVALMGEIYSKASKTLVWLGEAADGSDEIMEGWIDIGWKAFRLNMGAYFSRERLAALKTMFHDDNWDPGDHNKGRIRALAIEAGTRFEGLFRALKAWYARDWFTRVWVVQEFSLNRKPVYVCGHKRVPGWFVGMAEHLVQRGMGKLVDSKPDTSDDWKLNHSFSKPNDAFISSWFQHQRHVRGEGLGIELLSLLQQAYVGRGMNASDPRDRVYALLGLAVDTEDLNITVEYGDRDECEVLRQTASAFIDKGSLEVLSYSHHPKALHGLPSWVPEWRSHLPPSFYYTNNNATATLFAAGGRTLVNRIPMDGEPHKLGLRGFTVDIIRQTGSEWQGFEWDQGNYEGFLGFAAEMREMHEASTNIANPIYASDVRRAEALWRVPIADMSYDLVAASNRVRAPLKVKQQFDALETCCHLMIKFMDTTDPAELDTQEEIIRRVGTHANEYKQNMEKVKGMRPFLTHVGYLGMAVPQAGPGDIVVVFKGNHIPSVLRPLPEGDYLFIGEAYCDGIMDGELVGRSAEEDFFLV